MGRIIGYQYDDNVQDGDAWIGSEDGGGRTKQYTAEAVANYLNIRGKISIVGQMTYKYGITPLSGPGTFAVFGGGTDPVAFSAVTKLTLSNTDVSKQRVVEFLNLLVGSDILISKQSAISTFGYYSIDNYAVNATDPAYYDLGVTFKSGNGSMEAEQIYETQNFTLAAEENISTLQTTIDSGNTYQANPSNPLWTWGPGEITTTSTSFTSLLSSKRFKTTLIADGSYTDVLPNQLIFNNALGNETSITPNTALSSNIDLQWPSSSGILALTTDIISSPWDAVLGGINYAGGNVGIGTTNPSGKLEVALGTSSGSDGIFVKGAFAGGTAYTSSKNPFISLGTSTSAGYTSAIYLGASATATDQDSKIEFNKSNNALSIYYKGQGTYREHVRFGDPGNFTPKSVFFGNVGIGVTSPSTKLEVAGNILANVINATVNIGSTISSTPAYGYPSTQAGTLIVGGYTNAGYSYQPGVMTLINQNPNIGAGVDLGVIQFAGKDDATSGYVSTMIKAFTAANVGTGQSGGGIITISTTTTGYGDPIERFRINDSGNVGIGTTSPGSKLHVSSVSSNSQLTLERTGTFTGKYTMHTASNNFYIGNSAASTYPLTILNSGNVGIGTTSPVSKLELQDGTFTVDNGNINVIAGGISATRNSANNTGLVVNQQGTADILNLLDNGTEVLTVIDGGNVGIGTTSPETLLHLDSSVDAASGLTLGYVNSADRSLRVFFVNATGGNSIYRDADSLRFATGASAGSSSGATKMLLTDAGNVGIGTTSPTGRLEVDGGDFIINANYLIKSKNALNYIDIYKASDASMRFRMGHPSVGRFQFLNNANTEVFTIDARNEKVGIGTTSPQSKLNINGGTGSLSTGLTFGDGDTGIWEASDDNLRFSTTSTTRMVINSSGNVGIGTTSPSAKLEVVDSGTNTNINSRKDLSTTAFTSTYNAIQMSNFDTTANNWAKFSFAGNSGIPTQTAASIATQFLDHTNNYGDLTFWTRGSVDFDERMRITSTGNVGIGTTSPTSKLDVAGGDIELDDVAAGIIMRSPDGTKYRITVANGGTLTVTAV